MHGRLKVRTSEEQAEIKRKEKEKRVKWYRQTTDMIFSKRAAGDMDDEALSLTEQLVLENSDLSTMWNYRREILGSRLSSVSPEEASKLCEAELNLLEKCLRSNPKAYCVWLHRRWLLEHSAAKWDRELALCNLFLKYDERNFHCWDYRRYVVGKAGIPADKEFEYSREKIDSNFSNYSAWHYRSKLLPSVHPASTGMGGVSEEALQKEYELVQNAFYTDPSDQSAWIYHQWLLGKGSQSPVIVCMLLSRGPSPVLHVSFSQPVQPSSLLPLSVAVADLPPVVVQQSDWPRAIWTVPLQEEPPTTERLLVKVQYDMAGEEFWVEPGQKDAFWTGNLDHILSHTAMAANPVVLATELELCQELLQLEPDNKWCILTTLQLMEAIDVTAHYKEILSLYDRLQSVDPYRRGYYRDQRSKLVIGLSLKEGLAKFDVSSPVLDLSNKDLTRLFFTEHTLVFKEINLSSNQLVCLHNLPGLKHVQSLVLDRNKLQSLPNDLSELQQLRQLSVRDNDIEDVNMAVLVSMALTSLDMRGNPVCELETFTSNVTSLLPKLTSFNGSSLLKKDSSWLM